MTARFYPAGLHFFQSAVPEKILLNIVNRAVQASWAVLAGSATKMASVLLYQRAGRQVTFVMEDIMKVVRILVLTIVVLVALCGSVFSGEPIPVPYHPGPVATDSPDDETAGRAPILIMARSIRIASSLDRMDVFLPANQVCFCGVGAARAKRPETTFNPR